MGDSTAISWTDHTFQPWMGCSKVEGSPACDHCYAEALGKRTGKVQWGDDADRVMMSPAYWRNPVKWNQRALLEGRRHRVFCASLADVFEDRPELDEARARLWDLIAVTPQLDWQLLTKRPQNVVRMTPWAWRVGQNTSPPHTEDPANWPANVWIGTTVEDQAHAEERIPQLLTIPAGVRFLSCEPLLGPIEIADLLHECDCHRVDWVICGGESGGGHRPMDPEWARSLRDQCDSTGTAFFFKQWGGRFPSSGGNELDGEIHHAFPAVAS